MAAPRADTHRACWKEVRRVSAGEPGPRPVRTGIERRTLLLGLTGAVAPVQPARAEPQSLGGKGRFRCLADYTFGRDSPAAAIRDMAALRQAFFFRYIYDQGRLDRLPYEWARHTVYEPDDPRSVHVFTSDALILKGRIPAGGGLWPGGLEAGMLRAKRATVPGTYLELKAKLPRLSRMSRRTWRFMPNAARARPRLPIARPSCSAARESAPADTYAMATPCSRPSSAGWRATCRDLSSPCRSWTAWSSRGAAGLPHGTINPSDLVALPSRLNAPHLVLIIDEFDRVQDEATRDGLADTLKQASDRAANLSFVIVGVSTLLERLLGNYASVQRNVVSVHLPALNGDEIEAIIERGAAISGLAFSPGIIQEIAGLSCDSPYIAHLLGLRLSQSARERCSKVVHKNDLAAAIRRIAEETDPDALACYSEVIANQRAARSARQTVSASMQSRGVLTGSG